MSDAKLTLKVMVNRKENKFLYAEADSSFADVLLSFLTLPLGRIVRIMKKHYGDEAFAFGSLTTLYDGLANLDSVHFWTEGAKSILLHPRSLFDAECKMLKLDIGDSPPVEYFVCPQHCDTGERFESLSVCYDDPGNCPYCESPMICEYAKTDSQIDAKTNSQTDSFVDGAFTKKGASFFITEDLKMFPMEGILQIISHLGITDLSQAETMNFTFGFSEFMDLLKASLISSTPLSDIVFNIREGERTSPDYNYKVEKSSKHGLLNMMNLKVMVQKSTNKFLYAEAEDSFVDFLFSFLTIPLGGLERVYKGNSPIKSINTLYPSVCRLIGYEYFATDVKQKLTQLKRFNGYVQYSHDLYRCNGERTDFCRATKWNRSIKLPAGEGKFVVGPKTYKVADDLTVTPFCFVSSLSDLKEQKIELSDVEEVKLELGWYEVILQFEVVVEFFQLFGSA